MLLTLRKSGESVTGEQQIDNVQPIIAPVLFERASAVLTAGDKEKILAILRNKIDKATPLKVTGYTCDLGSKQANDALALQRATVVADLLQTQGYKVAVVNGEGKRDFVSTDPGMPHLNRRVEIAIHTQPAGENLIIQ
jgi:outer membrane protein OmpA-like peptidoglycan-associated protein